VPSWAIAISPANPERFARQLRLGEPAVLARVQENRVLVDLRTVLPHDEDTLVNRLLACRTD
jgi:L-seryl-tRNA(Ser) seleniumtransferase